MPPYEGYDITHNKDGSITFLCSPRDAGTYKIFVEKNGNALNGLPICCVVQETDAGYVTAYKTATDVDEELTAHADTLQSQIPSQEDEAHVPVEMETEDTAMDGEDGIILSLLESGEAVYLPSEEADVTEAIEQQQPQEPHLVEESLPSDQTALPPEEQYEQQQVTGESTEPLAQTEQSILIPISASIATESEDWPAVHQISDPDAIASIAAAAGMIVEQNDGDEEMMEQQQEQQQEKQQQEEQQEEQEQEEKEATQLVMDEEEAAAMAGMLQPKLEPVSLEQEENNPEVDEDLISVLENEPPVVEETKVITIKPEPEPGKPTYQVTTRRQSGRSINLPAKYRGETYIVPKMDSPSKRTPGRPRVPVADVSEVLKKKKEEKDAPVKVNEDKTELEPTFPCPECGRVFTALARMEKHIKIHEERVFICDVLECKKQFKIQQTLKEHREKVHQITGDIDTAKIHCGAKKCKETFDSLEEMRSHLTKAHKEEHICNVCYRVLGSSAKLVEHLDTHSEEPRFHCDFTDCNKSFKTKRLLECHIKLHDGKDLCPECGKEFTTRGNLNKHIEVIHKHPKKRKIPSTGIVTPELSNNELRSLMCDACGKFFKNKSCLKNHIREMHVMEELRVVDTDQEVPFRPFKCGYCGRGFKRQAVMREHIALHESTSHVFCTEPGCTKSFPTIYKLKDHVRMVHKDDGKVHMCEAPGCGKVFKKASALNVHLKKHSNIRFPCIDESCDRHFSTKFCMLNHYKLTHQNVEPEHVCTVCGKAFKLKLQLDRHLETHVERREHQCPICGKGFKTKSTLASHVKIHQVDQQHQCELCGKGFSRKYRLQEHLASHAQQQQQQQQQQTLIPTEIKEMSFEVQNALTELQSSSGKKHILIIEQVDLPEGMEF